MAPQESCITPRQLAVLETVVCWREERGVSPTYREVAEILHVSAVTVYEHVVNLERKGLIVRERYRSRALSVPEDVARKVLSHLATVLAVEGSVDRRSVTKTRASQRIDIRSWIGAARGSYALEVSEGIDDASLCPGDIIVVEERMDAESGQAVVARVAGNLLLRRLEREAGGVSLRSLNGSSSQAPCLPRDDVEVQGVAVAVLRRL